MGGSTVTVYYCDSSGYFVVLMNFFFKFLGKRQETDSGSLTEPSENQGSNIH